MFLLVVPCSSCSKNINNIYIYIYNLINEQYMYLIFYNIKIFDCFFLNWGSLHGRLNSYCEACSYKKKKHKKVSVNSRLKAT